MRYAIIALFEHHLGLELLCCPQSRPRHPNIQHPTSNIQHPTSNIQHPTSNIQHPASNIQHPASIVEDVVARSFWGVVGRVGVETDFRLRVSAWTALQ
eukprot:scaffold77541_cov66-Attheya_sp.AAC.1